MAKPLLSFWKKDGITGIGNMALLGQPLTAFFASRRCSGRAIRAAMDWTVSQALMKTPLIGGFHSPLEQSVLEVMLAAHAPVVIVIARKLETAQLSDAWREAVQAEAIAVVSMNDTQQRLTADFAMRRNYWIAHHSAHIVVAEAAPGGGLASCIVGWKNDRKRVRVLLDELGKQ